MRLTTYGSHLPPQISEYYMTDVADVDLSKPGSYELGTADSPFLVEVFDCCEDHVNLLKKVTSLVHASLVDASLVQPFASYVYIYASSQKQLMPTNAY